MTNNRTPTKINENEGENMVGVSMFQIEIQPPAGKIPSDKRTGVLVLGGIIYGVTGRIIFNNNRDGFRGPDSLSFPSLHEGGIYNYNHSGFSPNVNNKMQRLV